MNRFEPEEQVEELSVRSVPEENDAYIDYRKLHYKNTMPDNRVLVFLTGFCIRSEEHTSELQSQR